ncbi:hypothetical protein NP233_g802 [Leucocoprinus birnbaumii]|uniref:ATP-dependent DNA helicase n=1 Tax=Leucocoprinus birnbaumii TaxID=56174 RepID=A0AAD5Z014_9AGAR|nr:hypothetical protein NP233_g802 [Leucocoprinus birnbaumii]
MPRDQPIKRETSPFYQLQRPRSLVGSLNCPDDEQLLDGGVAKRVIEDTQENRREKVAEVHSEWGEPNHTAPASLNSGLKLSDEQKYILDVMKRGENVFFTGPAGTGKSVLLRAIISELTRSRHPEAVAITATTGVAALAIGGVTLHSHAGIESIEREVAAN